MNFIKNAKMVSAGALLLVSLVGGSVQAKSPQSVQNFPKAPELALGKNTWINTNGSPAHLFGTHGLATGRVLVLTFWTHGCINCKRTIPFWNDWAKRYNSKTSDVTVFSVHTPETDFERKPANVRRFVKERGIVFPVVTDNSEAIWNAFNVQAWPTTILVDKQGRIRARWEGELDYEHSGDYKKVEQTIEALRREK